MNFKLVIYLIVVIYWLT